jgi:hypothetical protein
MRLFWIGVALLILTCTVVRSELAIQSPDACLNVRTAALRLDALAETIQSCTSILNDTSLPAAVYAEVIAQRGMLHARRWRLTDLVQDAHRGIADITEGLRSHVFEDEKRRQLLIWRGQLYEAIGEPSKANDDFTTVLRIAPSDEIARAALRRLGAPTN